MDEDLAPHPRPASAPSANRPAAISSTAEPAHGGTIEPTAPVARDRKRLQASPEIAGERYELRDHFQEVTYRAKTFKEMIATAEQLGTSRITAIDAHGRRTPIRLIDGEWQRGDSLPALLKRAPDVLTTRDEVPDHSAGIEAALKTGPAAVQTPRADQARAKTLAKIDAQAERAAMVARIESELSERYIIKHAPVTLGDMGIGHTEYRFRGDSSRVAFTESKLRLSTDINSPSVARSMVDLAQARDWKGIRVSGSEEFRRMIWLEASVRGVKALGYEPNLNDQDLLRRARETRQLNRIEPAPETSPTAPAAVGEKSSTRGSSSRKTVVAAIEAVLIEKKVPEAKRQAVIAAAEQHLARMAREGHVPKIRVYDRSAERQLPISPPTPDINRQQDRSPPAHVR